MKFSKYTEHRPADARDPGFALPGYKLRWLGADLHERRSHRIWYPLNVSMLPDDLLKKLKSKNPFWFQDMAGDTIRRRGDVLGFAPINEVDEIKKEIKEKNIQQHGILNRKASRAVLERGRGDVETDSSTERITLGKEDFS